MRIYLNNNLLVQSEVFENPTLEANKPGRNNCNSQRDWWIYTWNSKNKLSSKEDGTSSLQRNAIEVSLRMYRTYKNKEESEFKKVSSPDHIIQISGYSSFIYTPKKRLWGLSKS